MGPFTQFIKQCGEFVMRGRREATLIALLFTIVPFMGWIATTIIALVTLRQGAREGFWILLWVLLVSLLVTATGLDNQLFGVITGSFVVWFLAVVLRATNSWQQVLQWGCLVGILGVLGTHIFISDLDQYWYRLLYKAYNDANLIQTMPLSPQELQVHLHQVAKVLTGVVAAFLLLVDFSYLALARWLQALLYNPGGFGKEFYEVKMGMFANACLLLIIVGILMGINVAWDLLALPLVVFFFAGLSLIHAYAARTKLAWGWLLGFYLLLIFFYKYILGMIILLALIDSWIDIRAKLVTKVTK